MMLWLLIGWPVSLIAACGVGARLHAAKPAAVQAAEDAEQGANLQAWAARKAYADAVKRGHTQGINRTASALRADTTARLRAELGR